MELFALPSGNQAQLSWQVVLLAGLLAFILSQIIALTYERTYEGMSYSRSLFQALAMMGILTTLLMFAVGNSLARGIGIAGIFAIIRFRTNLRDPRDIVFVFASLSIGIACGIQAFSLAIVGTFLFCGSAFYLQYVPLGNRQKFDGLLRFSLDPGNGSIEDVYTVLNQACESYSLVTLREISQGEALEYAFQVKLHEMRYSDSLTQYLRSLPGLSGLHLLLQETVVEL